MKTRCQNLWSLNANDFPFSGSKQEQLDFLLGYATLAPSGHNTQPWLFKVGNHTVDVVADRTRALPVVDPYDRELTISCGAAIGVFEVAARHFGFNTITDAAQTADEPDLLARISIEKGEPATIDETILFNVITLRRTNRTAFLMEPIPGDLVKACLHAAELNSVELVVLQEEHLRSAVAELVAEGDQLQFNDPRFRRELASWVHSARFGSGDGMSGASFGMPDILSPLGQFVIRTFDIGNGVAAGDKEKIVSGSPTLMIFGSSEESVINWLSTGRALARTLLLISSWGLTASYLNQPIEIEELRAKLKNVAEMKNCPQILIRVGRSNIKLMPTVRRNLTDVVIHSQSI